MPPLGWHLATQRRLRVPTVEGFRVSAKRLRLWPGSSRRPSIECLHSVRTHPSMRSHVFRVGLTYARRFYVPSLPRHCAHWLCSQEVHQPEPHEHSSSTPPGALKLPAQTVAPTNSSSAVPLTHPEPVSDNHRKRDSHGLLRIPPPRPHRWRNR
jgi:hypothetical protein